MKKINWLEHGIELLVVIIGISIAFWLNRWSERRRDYAQEQDYLVALVEDLEQDAGTLRHIMKVDTVKLRQLDSLIGFTYNPSEAPSPKVFSYYINNNYYLPIKPRVVTYQIMTSTGGLNLLRDAEMRQRIVEYYNLIQYGVATLDEALEKHVESYTVHYFTNNVRFERAGKIKKDFLQDPVFLNIMYGQRGLVARRMEFYQKTLNGVQDLITDIEATL